MSVASKLGALLLVFSVCSHGFAQCELLFAGDAAPGVGFGAAVVLDGDRVAISSSSTDHQTVYLFDRTPTGWVESARVHPAEVEPADFFGLSIALRGDRLLVGALGDDDLGLETGAAYLFERSGTNWNQVPKLTVAAGPIKLLGYSVAIGSDFLAVSAPNESVTVPGSGAIYVFEPSGPNWVQTAKLFEPLADTSDRLGVELVVSEDRILANATDELPAFSNMDAGCYLYERQGTTWSSTKIEPAEETGGFGRYLDIDGDRMVFAESSGAPGSGRLFVFELLAGVWTETGKFGLLDAEGFFDGFPSTVDVSGDVLLAGAWGDIDGGSTSGSAYLWSLSGSDCPSLFAAPDLLSLQSGGTHHLRLNGGADHAFDLYFLLGSATGTSPGLLVDGLTLPLNLDGYYILLLFNPNGLVPNSLGLLDAEGEALTQLVLPPGLSPSLAGVTLNHAYVAFDLSSSPLAAGATSIAQPLQLVP